jgi:hypothetical protein
MHNDALHFYHILRSIVMTLSAGVTLHLEPVGGPFGDSNSVAVKRIVVVVLGILAGNCQILSMLVHLETLNSSPGQNHQLERRIVPTVMRNSVTFNTPRF